MFGQTPQIDERLDVPLSPPDRRVTRCRLRVFRGVDGGLVAVATELPDNPGPSVTNAAEHVWRAVSRRLGADGFTLVEHYGPESYADREGAEDFFAYDVVTLTPAGRPQWRSIGRDGLRRLIVPGPARPA